LEEQTTTTTFSGQQKSQQQSSPQRTFSGTFVVKKSRSGGLVYFLFRKNKKIRISFKRKNFL